MRLIKDVRFELGLRFSVVNLAGCGLAAWPAWPVILRGGGAACRLDLRITCKSAARSCIGLRDINPMSAAAT
jgi:hypothetical protein